MNESQRGALDYFAGGVPAGAIFAMAVDDLEQIAMLRSLSGAQARRVPEVCFIGLVSYFEAFCKDQLASVLNILPELVGRLREKGHDTSVDSVTLVGLKEGALYQIGFLLCEKYDFGTAQKVNALYSALLKLTPFSKDEADTYARVLRDRNLLVHHGGTYTARYLAQLTGMSGTDLGRPFMDSLVVSPEYLLGDLTFLKDIATKIATSVHTAAQSVVESQGIVLDPERIKAINFLPYGLVGEI